MLNSFCPAVGSRREGVSRRRGEEGEDDREDEKWFVKFRLLVHSLLNKLNLSSKVILDSSNNYWGRFNFNAKTFQCHWYWYTWNQDKLTTKYTDFDYLITSNPPLPTNNICQELVTKAINLQQPIYQDSHYQVYKISK